MGMRDYIFQEYSRLKGQYQDTILFWRMGDFYEVYNVDAVRVSKCLVDITLDTILLAGKATPMTGVMRHSLSGALARMVRAGYKVASCEPGQGAKYEVVRLISPGLLDLEAAKTSKNQGRPRRPMLTVIQGGGNTTPLTRIVTRHIKPLP